MLHSGGRARRRIGVAGSRVLFVVERKGERRQDSNHLMTPERPGEQDEVGYRRDRLGVRFGGPTARIFDWP